MVVSEQRFSSGNRNVSIWLLNWYSELILWIESLIWDSSNVRENLGCRSLDFEVCNCFSRTRSSLRLVFQFDVFGAFDLPHLVLTFSLWCLRCDTFHWQVFSVIMLHSQLDTLFSSIVLNGNFRMEAFECKLSNRSFQMETVPLEVSMVKRQQK